MSFDKLAPHPKNKQKIKFSKKLKEKRKRAAAAIFYRKSIDREKYKESQKRTRLRQSGRGYLLISVEIIMRTKDREIAEVYREETKHKYYKKPRGYRIYIPYAD